MNQRRRPLTAAALLAACLFAAPALAEDVRLSNGDVISGRVVERTADGVVLEHPVLGRVTIPAADVVETGADLSAAPEPVADEPDLSPAEEAHLEQKPGLFDTPFLRGYDKAFLAGFNGSAGNSETISIFARFDARSESDRNRTDLLLRYFYGEEDGDKNRNDFKAQALRDWKFPDSKWFAFGQATYQYDDFEPFLHRVGFFAGPGYEFVDTDDLQVLGRVGAGAIWEGGDVNEWTVEALIDLQVIWQITDGQTFEVRNTLFPSLEDFFENRNVTVAQYVIEMDDVEDGLIFSIGIENEYESRTEGDFDHNDLKYFASVGLEF